MADNSKYLQESWSKRTSSAKEKVLDSIDALKAAKEPINFNSVSKKSGVSKHFLYGNEEIKALIESQRSEENARSGAWHKKYDRTSKSKDVIIESKDKYIFVYTVAPSPNIYNKAIELSKKTGLKIKWAHMSYKNFKGAQNIKNPSPVEFLNLIDNASYVLTSSFHGMALSIVFKKQFFYDLDINKINNNSRLTTLASQLQLEGREITFSSELLKYDDIDYSVVNQLLDKKREESIGFLKESLGI